jgi:hypothetical protein
MTVLDRDALDRAIVKMRAHFMAIRGADSIMDQGEADALQSLAADALRAFEAVQASIESTPIALAA